MLTRFVLARAYSTAAARWEEVGPPTYRVVQSRRCFCVPEVTRPVVVTVGSAGVSRTYQGSGLPVPAHWQPLFPTIAGMFELIEEAIDDGVHLLEARYDPGTGAPPEGYIDRDERIIDEEVRYILSLPEPLPAT